MIEGIIRKIEEKRSSEGKPYGRWSVEYNGKLNTHYMWEPCEVRENDVINFDHDNSKFKNITKVEILGKESPPAPDVGGITARPSDRQPARKEIEERKTVISARQTAVNASASIVSNMVAPGTLKKKKDVKAMMDDLIKQFEKKILRD